MGMKGDMVVEASTVFSWPEKVRLDLAIEI